MSEAGVVEADQPTEPQWASVDLLRAKKPAVDEFEINVNGQQLRLHFEAIGAVEYDDLLTSCPPTKAQQAEGASYNQDKFGPQLLHRVCKRPALSVEEWTEFWRSPDWNRGEIGGLFFRALNLCGRGLDVNPFGIASE